MVKKPAIKTICYFGFDPKLAMARNEVLTIGLKVCGVKIITCTVVGSNFLSKLIRLFRQHRPLRNSYDLLLVAYLSNLTVPLAKLISKQPVVYNALNSMYEGAVLDRQAHGWFSVRRYLIWLMDFLAFCFADLILVESNAQKEFIRKKFLVPEAKMVRLWTGADNSVFYLDSAIKKRLLFTVLFRGWFVPATGIEYVLAAAKILVAEKINFLIIGRGPLRHWVEETIKDQQLTNVELVTDFLSNDELRRQMLSCHVSLGQFADHPRLERTIQNKTFEALALGLPYITRDSQSNRELLTNGENCLFTKSADARDLADKIVILKNQPALRERLAQNGLTLYHQALTPAAVATRFLQLIHEIRLSQNNTQ